MIVPAGIAHVSIAAHYDQEFFNHFSHILNREMSSKVKNLPSDEDRSVFSRERVGDQMVIDLPRMNYFVEGQLVSVRGDKEISVEKLGETLQATQCLWAIKHLEELSAILHQGAFEMICCAKKLCQNFKWHPDLGSRINLFSYNNESRMIFCIYRQNKILFAVAGLVRNLMIEGGLAITDENSSWFDSVVYLDCMSVKADNGVQRLATLPSMIHNSGYGLELNIVGQM